MTGHLTGHIKDLSVNLLDLFGTLCRQSLFKGSPRTATRLVRGVLLAIGIALCSASPAGMAQPLPKISPVKYSEFQIGKTQTKCLFAIAKRESNINYKAHNKSSGAYGAWQIKNNKVAVKYINELIDIGNYLKTQIMEMSDNTNIVSSYFSGQTQGTIQIGYFSSNQIVCGESITVMLVYSCSNKLTEFTSLVFLKYVSWLPANMNTLIPSSNKRSKNISLARL